MKIISYKHINLTFTILFLFLLSYGKTSDKTGRKKIEPKTFAYVKNAINAEKMAYKFYIACAKQAREAGSKSIANSYEVIAGQENEHYLKFKDVARKLRIKYTEENIEVPLHTILENINKSIQIETTEASAYEEAIITADKEKYRYAKKTFEWALDVEKLHIDAFKKLLVRLTE